MSNCYWSVPSVRSASHDNDFSQRRREIAMAKEFFQQHFPDVANLKLREIDQRLWELRQDAIAQEDTATRYRAELCLRCRISNEIRNSCLELVIQFKDKQVDYDELFACLPYDDGQPLNGRGAKPYQPFTMEILHTYDPHRRGEVSLAKLVKRMVRQNEIVLQYLLDHGVLLRSDWALLNRASLSRLTTFEVAIVKAFHKAYRGDRRGQHTSRTDGRCPPPTPGQLQKMLELLQERGLKIESQAILLDHLTTIALFIRKQEIAKMRSFPVTDSLYDFGNEDEVSMFREMVDESITNNPFEAVALRAFQAFCDQMQQQGWNLAAEVDVSLVWGVERGICDRITFFKSKPKRAHLAELFEQGLYLTYCEALNQTEIGERFGMKQYKVCTLLDLGGLNQQYIPAHAVEKLFRQIVQMIQTLELSINTSDPEYESNLILAIHAFLAPIFREAEVERRNPKSRQMKSRLAQHIQTFLKSRRSQTA